jgi:hypothetical protein
MAGALTARLRAARGRCDSSPSYSTPLAGCPKPPLALIQLTRQRPNFSADCHLIDHTVIDGCGGRYP